MSSKIRNIIVVSDTHCGCRLGLCPPSVQLDDGGTYEASDNQRKVWSMWEEFWCEWVPHVTRGEPFVVVANGDIIDGVHHQSTTPISHNLQDQRRICRTVFEPVRDVCEGRLYIIRGTEAHGGKSGSDEETVADVLGAIPNEQGQHARWDLWLSIGNRLIHFLHHIGTTGSNAYEGTAIGKELVEEYAEAGRWGRGRPDCIVRSHRHRHMEVRIPTNMGYGISFVTAAWQLKTPFLWKGAGSRLSEPQFGGSLIRLGDEDLYTRHRTWSIDRSQAEEI